MCVHELNDLRRAWDYFKIGLFVLVKAHGDSSTTGHLSWTQASSETEELSSHTPPWWPQGPSGLSYSCSMSSQHTTKD